MASADDCSRGMSYLIRPAFQASLTHGYACRPRAGKSVNFRCTSSPSTLESVGKRFCCPRAAHLRFSLDLMAFLYVASQLWRDAAGCYADRASQASFPRLVTLPQLPSPST